MWAQISLLGNPVIWVILSMFLIIAYLLPRFTVWRGKKRGPKRRKFKIFLFIFLVSLYLTFGVIQAAKSLNDTPRPCVLCPAEGCNPYCLPDSTFPSGHSATIFVFFSSLVVVFRKKWTIPLFIIPVLVGLSRVFLGVHYKYDVLVGSFIGFILPFIVLETIKHIRSRKTEL